MGAVTNSCPLDRCVCSTPGLPLHGLATVGRVPAPHLLRQGASGRGAASHAVQKSRAGAQTPAAQQGTVSEESQRREDDLLFEGSYLAPQERHAGSVAGLLPNGTRQISNVASRGAQCTKPTVGGALQMGRGGIVSSHGGTQQS